MKTLALEKNATPILRRPNFATRSAALTVCAAALLLMGQGEGCNTDADGDGWEVPDDCDDSNASVHPGAAEICDGIDNDCDGRVDDLDMDGSPDDCSKPPASGLIGWWAFEDSSTTVEDLSGMGNHGIRYGAVEPVTGQVGQGYQMADYACVVIPDSASLSLVGLSSVSYMAWINYTSPCNSDRGIILNKESTYEMGIECSSDRFQEAIQASDGSWFWTGDTAVTRNTWQHVAVVWDGSYVQRYLDGMPIDSPRELAGTFAERDTGMGLGCRSVDASGTTPGGSYFNGSMDEVAVYDRPLNADEIAAYVAATR